jgi:hypothetical protein
MDSLSGQMSELITLSSASGELLVKMNDMGIQLSNEIKKSGDTTIDLARINLKLGWCVLIVAVAGLFWSLYVSLSDSREQTRMMQGNKAVMEEIAKTLKSIDHNVGIHGTVIPVTPVANPAKTSPKK